MLLLLLVDLVSIQMLNTMTEIISPIHKINIVAALPIS